MVKLIDVYVGFPLAAHAIKPGAAEFLYELLLERPEAANISHQEPPAFTQHLDFMLGKPYRYWYIVEAEGEWVGAVYATRQNEIGIAIARKHQRKGYAAQAITALTMAHHPLPPVPAARSAHWVAHVAPGNEPSKHLFEALGAKPIAITYRLP